MSARGLSVSLLAFAAVAVTAAGSVGASAAASRSSAAATSVRTMVVGTGGAILSPARTVTARASVVHVGRKSCAVAGGTPLAVLDALRRSGGPGYALRDYGRCGSAPVNSGQLFVYSLGGEANRGQNGWEYKVGNLSGTTGAGDLSGARGDGRRLRPGARVLWFWCNASGGGCQRTLAVAPSIHTVARGAPLRVTVSGYDNEGRGVPIGGAIVTLASDFASTDSHGRATVLAPRTPGAYSVDATRNGLVPSFPETIVVR
jgi:hypothetical protein